MFNDVRFKGTETNLSFIYHVRAKSYINAFPNPWCVWETFVRSTEENYSIIFKIATRCLFL